MLSAEALRVDDLRLAVAGDGLLLSRV